MLCVSTHTFATKSFIFNKLVSKNFVLKFCSDEILYIKSPEIIGVAFGRQKPAKFSKKKKKRKKIRKFGQIGESFSGSSSR